MCGTVLIFFALFVLANTAQGDEAYKFAIDISNTASAKELQCIYDLGYDVAFIQVYASGIPNLNGLQTIRTAASVKLGIEVYITPDTSGKSGADQLTEALNAIKAQSLGTKSIWLQVSNPINWSSSVANNVLLIQSFINQAQVNNIAVGIYTNYNDWQQITANYIDSSTLRLWYYNVLGEGSSGETDATFNDFRPFGQWTQPNVKQFAQNENLCGINVNRNVFPNNKVKKENQVAVVGGAF